MAVDRKAEIERIENEAFVAVGAGDWSLFQRILPSLLKDKSDEALSRLDGYALGVNFLQDLS